jgi:hypothetical protein
MSRADRVRAVGAQSMDTAGDTPLATETPRSFLGWSIAAMVLCFLPFGIVSAVFAVRSTAALEEGYLELAIRRRQRAKRWAIAALVTGLVIDIFVISFLLLLGAFGR